MAVSSSAELSPAAEDYLVEIAALADRGGSVTGATLARRLGVSPPSVTQMVGRLTRANLVAPRAPAAGERPDSPRRAAGITLTPDGAAHAAWLLQRRRVCERFFEVVGGLDAPAARAAADAAEHGLGESATRRMKDLLGCAAPEQRRDRAPAGVAQPSRTIPGSSPRRGAPLPQACGRAGRVQLTAARVEGPCASDHRAGDTFVLTRHTPAGLCGASYAALLPWIRWMLSDAPDNSEPLPQGGQPAITQRCPGDGYVVWRAEALDS